MNAKELNFDFCLEKDILRDNRLSILRLFINLCICLVFMKVGSLCVAMPVNEFVFLVSLFISGLFAMFLIKINYLIMSYIDKSITIRKGKLMLTLGTKFRFLSGNSIYHVYTLTSNLLPCARKNGGYNAVDEEGQHVFIFLSDLGKFGFELVV